MKITTDVPRTFDITLEQMDAFLISSGWGDKTFPTENACWYHCIKYPDVCVILPTNENLIDHEYMIISALRLIANVNYNCSVETIINRIVGGD